MTAIVGIGDIYHIGYGGVPCPRGGRNMSGRLVSVKRESSTAYVVPHQPGSDGAILANETHATLSQARDTSTARGARGDMRLTFRWSPEYKCWNQHRSVVAILRTRHPSAYYGPVPRQVCPCVTQVAPDLPPDLPAPSSMNYQPLRPRIIRGIKKLRARPSHIHTETRLVTRVAAM